MQVFPNCIKNRTNIPLGFHSVQINKDFRSFFFFFFETNAEICCEIVNCGFPTCLIVLPRIGTPLSFTLRKLSFDPVLAVQMTSFDESQTG
jgi:hypothetical protein